MSNPSDRSDRSDRTRDDGDTGGAVKIEVVYVDGDEWRKLGGRKPQEQEEAGQVDDGEGALKDEP